MKSQSLAKVLLVALVAIASTSGYYAKTWQASLGSARASVQSAQQSLSTSERAFRELSEVLTPDETTLSLEEALSQAVLDVYNLRVPYGIVVTSATPSTAGGGPTAIPIGSLSEALPETKAVRSIRLNVRGTYTNYIGLLEYIQALQKNPLSVVFLQVRDQSYELSIRVYGEPKAE